MDRGSYIAASGGVQELRRLEVVNNNLANINTPGFKKQILVGEVQSFDQTLAKFIRPSDPYAKGDHDRAPGVMNPTVATDFSPGGVKNTGNPLDVALRNANEFFVLNTADGVRYTRAGNFTLNAGGEVVTVDGTKVQGDGGPITVTGGPASIQPDGSVRAGGLAVGRLQVVRIDALSDLEREEGSRFKLLNGAAPTAVEPQVVPESLEMSNVSAVSSMIDLINANRGFQLYTKSAESIDQMNQSAINQVGRPRT